MTQDFGGQFQRLVREVVAERMTNELGAELDRAIFDERATLALAELMVVKSQAKLAGLIVARDTLKRVVAANHDEPSETPDRLPLRYGVQGKPQGYSFG